MNNAIFFITSSMLLVSIFLTTSFVSPLSAQQQNQTAESNNMTSTQQQNQTDIGTASEIENLTGDNTAMMQTDISNTSLTEGLQSEQNTTDVATNQTTQAGQAALNQTGQSMQPAINQTGEAGQAVMNETGEALSNASQSGLAQNASQGGQAIANKSGEAVQSVVNETGDILSNITGGIGELLGIK
jgi:hypothetical protein